MAALANGGKEFLGHIAGAFIDQREIASFPHLRTGYAEACHDITAPCRCRTLQEIQGALVPATG